MRGHEYTQPVMLKTKRPKFNDYRGRTWDSCVEVHLPNGKVTKGTLDTSWGEWVYYQIGDTWYKTPVQFITDVGYSMKLHFSRIRRREDR